MSDIPDNETLFRFAKPEAFPIDQKDIPTSIFIDKELSCDWQKYRENPFTSFHINEGRSIIVSILVNDDTRNPTNPKRAGEKVPDWKQLIIHKPVTELEDPKHGANDAHSLIIGSKKKAVVDAIVKNSKFYHNSNKIK